MSAPARPRSSPRPCCSPRTASSENHPKVIFGQTTRKSGANDGSEARRTVDTTLRALDGNLVRIGKTGQQACDGDSGGPALLTADGVETLIATDDLAATDANCAGGDLCQRVDLHLDFIDKYL